MHRCFRFLKPAVIFRKASAFTLAELLIALAILGVIATFTIPKVLQSQRDGRWNAGGKEAMAMISGAFESYRLKNTVAASTRPSSLTPYMNYVRLDTVSQIDEGPNSTTASECAWDMCLRLHNGALLYVDNTMEFGVLDNNHYIVFKYDPDGKFNASATAPGKTAVIILYPNGKITLSTHAKPGDVTFDNGSPVNYGTGIPDWFSWSS